MAVAVTPQNKSARRQENNWSTQPDIFTGDDVVDAYLQGKEDGQTQYTRVLFSQFKKNMDLAQTICEQLIGQLKKEGFPIVDAFLKSEGITNFISLMVVKESDFLDDKFRKAFTLARTLKDKNLNDNFHIAFNFMPDSPNLNLACIHADGYFLKYEKTGSVSPTRKS